MGTDDDIYKFARNPTFPLLVVAAVGLAASVWSMTHASQHAIRMAAMQDAEILAESVVTLRSVYSEQVLSKIDSEWAGSAHTNDGSDGTVLSGVPLKLSLRFAEEFGKGKLGSTLRVYSPYPFDSDERSENFPDAFAEKAWASLRILPDQPVMEFQEKEGRSILRYAKADVMAEQCIQCHNAHPDSPVSSWKVGDLAGVVEVAIPLDLDLVVDAATEINEGLTFFSFFALLWFSVVTLTLLAARKANRTASYELEQHRLANAELKQAIEQREIAETETRQLEGQIQHAQKLESLSLMTGGIAHDFNNMLVPILANTDLLRDELPTGSEGFAMVEDIDMAAGRAAGLCRQMLTYAGKANSEQKTVDLNRSIEEMSQILTVTIPKSSELVLDLNNEVLMTTADPIQIEQIILNLITNASEAMNHDGGSILVRTGSTELPPPDAVSIDVEDSHSTAQHDFFINFNRGQKAAGVFFEVIDNGAGIPLEAIGKIFDPFYSTKFTGRGLGLAAVQGIAQAHGGSVSVDSILGNSTTIRIVLPAAKAAASLDSTLLIPEAPLWQGKGKILLADDEDSVRAVTKRMIEGIGFETTEACNGEEAVRLFAQNPDAFSACVLDMTMPKKDGVEALHLIRSLRPSLPCILISGYSIRIEEVKNIEDHHTIFVPKPFRSRTLHQKLEELVRPDRESSLARSQPTGSHPRGKEAPSPPPARGFMPNSESGSNGTSPPQV